MASGERTAKLGRPRVDAEPVFVRMKRPELDALDALRTAAWGAEGGANPPSRPQAVERIVADWIARHRDEGLPEAIKPPSES